MIDLTTLTVTELLILHARAANELRVREILRSSNNPTGDLAEYLFCKAFDWQRSGNSFPNVDAVSHDNIRYQIKARRITRYNKSRQLSAIRDLSGRHFQFLAGILFDEQYGVLRAAIIPYAIVEERATFVKRTNSYKFILHDDVWQAHGVKDVSDQLAAVSL